MMIRKECLGVSFSKKSPHNGCHFSGVITDNPENFALYKVLQLDVFEADIPPIAEIVEYVKVDPNKVIQTNPKMINEGVSKSKKKKQDLDDIN